VKKKEKRTRRGAGETNRKIHGGGEAGGGKPLSKPAKRKKPWQEGIEQYNQKQGGLCNHFLTREVLGEKGGDKCKQEKKKKKKPKNHEGQRGGPTGLESAYQGLGFGDKRVQTGIESGAKELSRGQSKSKRDRFCTRGNWEVSSPAECRKPVRDGTTQEGGQKSKPSTGKLRDWLEVEMREKRRPLKDPQTATKRSKRGQKPLRRSNETMKSRKSSRPRVRERFRQRDSARGQRVENPGGGLKAVERKGERSDDKKKEEKQRLSQRIRKKPVFDPLGGATGHYKAETTKD